MNKKIVIKQVHGDNLIHDVKLSDDFDFCFNALCSLTETLTRRYDILPEELIQGLADCICVFPDMIKDKGKKNDNI